METIEISVAARDWGSKGRKGGAPGIFRAIELFYVIL
jgi:hypothetical protein